MELIGLHHVTAVTSQAKENVAFYTRVLGMRLVKKTVNQDDVSAYHLFYADAKGSPGTDLTFFDWPDMDANRPGAGSISEIALRVASQAALEWWAQRLSLAGVPHQGIVEENGRKLIHFSDPEGQALALVNDEGSPGGGVPWERSPVPGENAIRGLHAVRLTVRNFEPTARVLGDVLGFRLTGKLPSDDDPQGSLVLFETGPGGPGAQVIVDTAAGAPLTRLGRGGVHHVAFRTPNEAEQVAWREKIFQSGLRVTEVIDRFYFKSIYFREPGGILFEIATDGPGFTADEDEQSLGESLALPPFLEPRRVQIEAQLKPL